MPGMSLPMTSVGPARRHDRARAFSDTFAGIRADDVAPFVAAQLVGALAALVVAKFLLAEPARSFTRAEQPAE